MLARLAKAETLRNYEARLRRKDGSLREVLINANALWENNKFIHSRCITRDKSERPLAGPFVTSGRMDDPGVPMVPLAPRDRHHRHIAVGRDIPDIPRPRSEAEPRRPAFSRSPSHSPPVLLQPEEPQPRRHNAFVSVDLALVSRTGAVWRDRQTVRHYRRGTHDRCRDAKHKTAHDRRPPMRPRTAGKRRTCLARSMNTCSATLPLCANAYRNSSLR